MHLNWQERAVTPEEAVRSLPARGRVFVHGAAATPTPLLLALANSAHVERIRLYHLHTEGPYPFLDDPRAERFVSTPFFVGAQQRAAVAAGTADYVPIFLSDVPALLRDPSFGLDAAVVQLSAPDGHGMCSLGTSVDAARAAVDAARVVVAEINLDMPRTLGSTAVPLSKLAAFTVTRRPLPESPCLVPNDAERRIGELVAGLIEDGSTLQMGIGGIPNAVLQNLGNKHHLGVHTEMFSDGVLPLYHGGVITNAKKTVYPGLMVTSFVRGTKSLYDFVHDNPAVSFQPCDHTNDTSLLRKLDRLVAINSALEVDLTGQVCADSVGDAIYSGIGGQMDFMRGAALARGGVPILAMRSVAKGGSVSRIVARLQPGAGVVTTRGHVRWVVTEHGAVNLHGKTLRQRAELLIGIAHPSCRGDLLRQVREVRHFDLGAALTRD